MKNFYKFYLPIQYFECVCRVCLSKHEVLIPIKEINLTHNLTTNGCSENISLKTIFEKFCNVEITESDNKPQKICEFCINMVAKAFNNLFQLFSYSNSLLDTKIHEHNLLQDSKPNDNNDMDSNCVLSTIENDSSDAIRSKPVTAEKDAANCVKSDDIGNNTLVPVKEINNKLPVPVLRGQNENSTIIQRKTTKRKYNYSVLNPNNKLLNLDPVKKSALKLLMNISKRFTPFTLEKRIIGKRDLRKIEEQHEIFRCRFCLKRFNNISKVIQHLKDEHEDIKRCILCPTKFSMMSRLLYHLAAHSQNGLICRICHIYFETKEDLDHHMDNIDHTNIKKCPKCQKTFPSSYFVREHINAIHLKKRNFQCRICGLMFIYKNNMQRHEIAAHGSRKFLCQVCGKAFTANYQMKLHMQKIHFLDQGLIIKTSAKKKDNTNSYSQVTRYKKQFECKFCPKKYPNSYGFYMHSETHPEFKEYRCDICNEIFETKREHEDHYTIHEKFPCPYPNCDRMFPSAPLALRHERAHKKPHKCNICNAEFRLKINLRDHMNIHTDHRPYVCEHCGQGFKQKGSLQCHIQVLHQGIKSWQCQLCNKGFNYRSTLRCHMRSHTGEKPFPCLFCKRMFRDTTGRHKHVKSDHPKKMTEFLAYKEKYQNEEIKKVNSESSKVKEKKNEEKNNSEKNAGK